MKKMLSLFLCLCMVFSFAVPAFAAEDDTAPSAEIPGDTDTLLAEEENTAVPADTGSPSPDHGNVTDTIDWAVSKDFILTITGSGEMPDYAAIGETPWADHFEKITAIRIDGSITRVGANSFAYCSEVTEVTLPETLVSIGDSAFRGLDKLENISFPASLRTIGKFAFAFNDLKTIALPAGLDTLGDSAFNPSNAITELTLPGGLTAIGEGAFGVCPALTTVTVSEGITDIGTCFINCYALETLRLPSTLETLNKNFVAGRGTDAALKTITVADKTVAGETVAFVTWLDEAGNRYTGDELAVTMTDGSLTPHWAETSPAYPHGEVSSTIQWSLLGGELSITGTGKMPDYAAGDEAPWAGLGTAAVLRVTVGEGITHVGAYAFHSCESMELLSLPSTIASLGAYSFNATSLDTITVTETGGREFLGWGAPNDGDLLSSTDLLTVTSAVTAQWYGFYDVIRDDWFYEYVMDCYDGGTMNGIGDGTFDPDGGATRAEVVTVLYRLAGESTDGSGTAFRDVAEDDWFADAVIWAADTGIAKGYDDGGFHPYAYVTREEFLVFLDRFAASQDLRLCNWSEDYDLSNLGIRDSGSISSWARESETWSYLIGLQTGYDNGDDTRSLYPRATITRAELATFLSRFNENLLLFVYAECSQYLIGQTIATAVAALKTEPEEKLELGDDRFAWCFYDEGVALIVDYGTDSRGIVVDWTYVV